jgi:hypothetical protein
MTLHPITDTAPACFGVMCHLHGDCTRYRAIDSMASDAVAIGTCATPPAIERPMFIAARVGPTS